MIEVLVPYHGDPDLMREAMRSVFAQTVAPARVVVVDDAYPEPWLAPWLERHTPPHLRAALIYERNLTNLGANRNYTKALRLARSEYVTIMGADDLMDPDYIARGVAVIENYNRTSAQGPVAVVQPGVRVIASDGAPAGGLIESVKAALAPQGPGVAALRGEALAVSLLHGNWTYFPSLIWHRATISDIGFRDYHIVQDLGLLIDVARRGHTLLRDNEQVTFSYRRHAGSDSAIHTVGGARFAEERAFFAAAAAELQAQGWTRAARAARTHWTSRAHAAWLAPAAIRGGRPRAAVRALRHALT